MSSKIFQPGEYSSIPNGPYSRNHAMTDPEGYVPMWRRVQRHWVYEPKRERTMYEAWEDLIMQARHSKEPAKVQIGMELVECGYGQCIRSETSWAKRWKWTRSRVRRFLALLEKDSMIVRKSTTKTTILTIVNYKTYNSHRPSNEHQTNNERTSNEHQTNTNNNVNNENNVNNGKNTEEILWVVDAWNKVAQGTNGALKEVSRITDAREKLIKTRLKDKDFSENYPLLFEKVAASPWHTGTNDSGWTASFNWIMEHPKKHADFLEGVHDKKAKKTGTWKDDIDYSQYENLGIQL